MNPIQQLQSLGLSENEAKVYLDIADIGKATAQAISKRTKIPRTTAYWILDNLSTKGLVTIEKKKDTSYFSINQPSSLVRMVQDEKKKTIQELIEREKRAEEIAESIQPYFKRKGYSLPRLQVFEGQEAINAMLFDYLSVWQESIFCYDSTWWGYQDHTFAEQYMEWLRKTWEVKQKYERYCIITNKSEVEEQLASLAPHRGMKFIQPGQLFSSTIWVLGDYIVLIMTAQKPHYAFQIRDPAFGSNLRSLFKILWHKVW